MSVSRHQGKWRFEFMIDSVRYRQSGFETKQAARDAEAERRKDLKRMNLDFLRLCKSRLRDLKINRTKKYLKENRKLVKNLIRGWGSAQLPKWMFWSTSRRWPRKEARSSPTRN